jgi:ABC-2 type transport system ATP-binding protein
VHEPENVLARIGYLSEDHDLPRWMRIHELLRYNRAFYPGWDPAYADELVDTFGLDRGAKIKTLSRGQRAQAGLVCALAHRPDLLLLDEPSAGLDAVVRRDILGAVIRTVADEGRTVLFSSHLLDEVERVADTIAMIHQGQMALCASLDELKSTHHRVTLNFSEPQTTAPTLEGVLHIEGSGREWTVVCDGAVNGLCDAVTALGANIVEEATPSLEDIFVARVGRHPLETPEA